MSQNYEDERTRKRLIKILQDVSFGKVPQAEAVTRLTIEYMLREIDNYNTANKGRSDAFQIRLPTTMDKSTKIYFTAEYQDSGIPANSFVSHPKVPVSNMLIINMGPNKLKFGTNRMPDEVNLTSDLETQEFKNIPTAKDRNTIFSLFMRTEQDPAVTETYSDIRVEFLY